MCPSYYGEISNPDLERSTRNQKGKPSVDSHIAVQLGLATSSLFFLRVRFFFASDCWLLYIRKEFFLLLSLNLFI